MQPQRCAHQTLKKEDSVIRKLLLLTSLMVFYSLSGSLFAEEFIFKFVKNAMLMTIFMLASAFVACFQEPFKNLFTSRSAEYWEEETIDEPLVSDYSIPANRRKPILEQDTNI